MGSQMVVMVCFLFRGWWSAGSRDGWAARGPDQLGQAVRYARGRPAEQGVEDQRAAPTQAGPVVVVEHPQQPGGQVVRELRVEPLGQPSGGPDGSGQKGAELRGDVLAGELSGSGELEGAAHEAVGGQREGGRLG